MGRQLAARRKAAGLSQESLGAQTQYSRSSIGSIEVGRQHVDRSFWEKADALLGADGELARGYDAAEALQRVHQRPARDFSASVEADLPVAPADRTASASASASVPRRGHGAHPSPFDRLASLSIQSTPAAVVGWGDVHHVQFITRTLAFAENTFGGGPSSQAAAAQLRCSARLVEAQAPDDVRRAMSEAVGNLSGVVGFSAFDVGDFQSASDCFDFELWCAERAESWTLRASALSDMARLAMYLGDTDEALSLIELAQVRSDRLTATICAMLSAMRSRLLALRGRYDEARSEVIRADEYFANRKPSDDPPWMSYYDEAEHQGSTGRALVPVALKASDLAIVAPRMQQAIRLHDDGHPRSRAFSRTRLASLTMKIGDPRQAAAGGQVALAEASTVRSARLRAELDRLAVIAAPHRGIPEVAALIRDITASGQRDAGY